MNPQLLDFLNCHKKLAVLSGAGCSTASGIPDYRADDGSWKHARPVQFRDFVDNSAIRRRYWARSFAGWERVRSARPNAAHRALAALEQAGRIDRLITQNVDNLHRLAGSASVIDLHGVLGRVRCLDCGIEGDRNTYQAMLQAANPDFCVAIQGVAPDGDAHLVSGDIDRFVVPPCTQCGGMIKPDVVFFGEAVPKDRVAAGSDAVSNADALLVVGSSLQVFSGFRFVRQAHALRKPVAILNRGVTRADDLATLRLREDCCAVLEGVVRTLQADDATDCNSRVSA